MFFFLFFALADVISEGVIVKWYEEAHSNKGKIMFLQQMKQFKEWLETAEEGKSKMSFCIQVVAPFDNSRSLSSSWSGYVVGGKLFGNGISMTEYLKK